MGKRLNMQDVCYCGDVRGVHFGRKGKSLEAVSSNDCKMLGVLGVE